MQNDLLFLVTMAVVYMSLTIAIEYATAHKLAIKRWREGSSDVMQDNVLSDPYVVLDDDVRREAERVQKLLLSEDHQKEGDRVLMVNMHKTYSGAGCCKSGREVHAVRGVNLGVKQGEVFGYLGVNGAGKTTTMSCLSGDEAVSIGDAFVNGIPIAEQAEIRRFIGFCPQNNVLFDGLTAREHLKFYGRIKGLNGAELRKQTTMLLDVLSLNQYADRKAGNLSGGNKRKLSVAMAMIGNPPIVFLDEVK